MRQYDEVFNPTHERSRMKVRKEGKWIKVEDHTLTVRVSDLAASLEANSSCEDPQADELVQSVYALVARQLRDILK